MVTKKELLDALNKFLKYNSKAREYQVEFENMLVEYNQMEDRSELSDVMDRYIDLYMGGVDKATLENLEDIIEQSIEQIRIGGVW